MNNSETTAVSKPPDEPWSRQNIREALAKMPSHQKAKLVVQALEGGRSKVADTGDQKENSSGDVNEELLLGVLQEFKRDLDLEREKVQQKTKPSRKATQQKLQTELHVNKKPADTSFSPKLVANFLSGQHPVVSALALSEMETSKVASVLKIMKVRHAQKTALLLSDIETARQSVPRKSKSIIATMARHS